MRGDFCTCKVANEVPGAFFSFADSFINFDSKKITKKMFSFKMLQIAVRPSWRAPASIVLFRQAASLF